MCPADPQPNYRNQPEELAAFIDGEITDMNRIEQLKHLLQGDTALSAEYEAQRQVKLLLGELPETEAPSFMATRIMGEISAKKRQRHGVWLPKWGAAAAAVAVFGVGYVVTQHAGNVHMMANNTMLADSATRAAAPEGVTAALPQADLNQINATPALESQAFFASDVSGGTVPTQDYFQTVYDASNAVEIPADAEPWLREFIELGNEAHNYSRAMRLTHNVAAPDVSQAVMVVDSH